MFVKTHRHRTDRTVALFGDFQSDFNAFGGVNIFRWRRRRLRIQKHNQIRVLFNRAAVAQIGKLRALVGAPFNAAVQLRKRDDRRVQFFRQRLQAAADSRHFFNAVVVCARAGRRAHDLQVIHDNQLQINLFGLQFAAQTARARFRLPNVELPAVVKINVAVAQMRNRRRQVLQVQHFALVFAGAQFLRVQFVMREHAHRQGVLAHLQTEHQRRGVVFRRRHFAHDV